MYVLYEGTVKIGFESETLSELIEKLSWEEGGAEYGSRRFNGEIDVYYGTEAWQNHIDALHPVEGYEDEADPDDAREKDIAQWLNEIGMPREIGDADSVICVGGYDGEVHALFVSAPTPEELNELFAKCMSDMGYRIVEE